MRSRNIETKKMRSQSIYSKIVFYDPKLVISELAAQDDTGQYLLICFDSYSESQMLARYDKIPRKFLQKAMVP